MGSRRRSMTIEEEDAFLLTFDTLMDELSSLPTYSDMEETIDWLRRAVFYNVPGGKQIRGRGVIAAYKALVEDPTEAAVQDCYVLGWCIEIFQASFLIANDIIDNAEKRRGKLCWYLVDQIGDLAINDAFLLSSIMNIFIDRHFFHKEVYNDLVELFHEMHMKTSFGQCMDVQCCKRQAMEGFTMNQYKKIVKYKTSYHSFYLPVACALILAGETDKTMLKEIENLVLEMGLLFQVQDDYLDCYSRPEVTGKSGTDIPENKCSWLAVVAYGKANDEQKAILKENYGRGKESTIQNEKAIREIYDLLSIPEEYKKFEDSCYESICQKIAKLQGKIPTTIFSETADLIYRRNK